MLSIKINLQISHYLDKRHIRPSVYTEETSEKVVQGETAWHNPPMRPALALPHPLPPVTASPRFPRPRRFPAQRGWPLVWALSRLA